MDIFFTPQYGKLLEKTGFGGEYHNFTHGITSYSFYKRPIPNSDYFDITSPYGYSGALNPTPEFLADFHEYCYKNNIVAEFARLHPFLENHKGLEAVQSGEVYYIDLTQPFKFDKGCKSAIKKAKDTLAVTTEWMPWEFDKLYTETMDRNHASKEYYFGHAFFDELGKIGQMFSAFTYDPQLVVVASIIILKYKEYAHYFLAGSDNKYRFLNGSNLVLYVAISWAKYQGCKIFNLGGGKDDTHASFKRSFSKLSKPFYTYRKIHNQKIYDLLSMGLQTDYFPAYRVLR